MVCEEEHHAGDSVDESHSTGTEVEARVSCFEISAFACICVQGGGEKKIAPTATKKDSFFVAVGAIFFSPPPLCTEALCTPAEHGAVTEV